jgi:plasmid segregation protein ParM
LFEKLLGIDVGYGYVKAYDGEKEIIFPSVVGIGHKMSFMSQLSTYKSPLANLSIEYNGRHYFIGDYAIRQSTTASRSLDIKRPEDINTLLLFITALGLYSPDQRQRFYVVTGLPTNYIASYENQLTSLLEGDHTIRQNIRGNRSEKQVTVSSLKIVPQPFGTLFNQVLNTNGEIADENLANKKVGIADIGFKTADFVVSDRLEFVQKLSSSSTSGMVSAYQIVASIIRSKYKIDKKDYELDEIVKKKTIKIAGKNHDISDIVAEAYTNLASKFKTELDSLWDFRELDTIILTGGGGEALSEYLIPQFNNMILAEEAQFSNVKGFWKLAKNIYGE